MERFHEQMLAVRRGLEGPDQDRRSELFDLAGDRSAYQLSRQVVLEQGLVVGVLQQVLVGPCRRGATQVLLDDGSLRHAGLGRRGAATRRDDHTDHGAAVRHPLERSASGGREFAAERDLSRPGAGHVGDPKLEAGTVVHREGDVRAVRRPRGPGESSVAGNAADHLGFPAVPLLHGHLRDVADPARPVGRRLDPQARQPQLGLGQLGDRDQARILREERPLVVRREVHRRCRRRVDDRAERLGRPAVALRRPKRSGEQGEQSDDHQGSLHGEPSTASGQGGMTESPILRLSAARGHLGGCTKGSPGPAGGRTVEARCAKR